MQPCVFVVAVIVATLASEGLALPGYPHSCKTEIINKITKIWDGKPPTGIVDHLKTVGEERVVYASEHYITIFKAKHRTSELKCFYAKWYQEMDDGKGALVFAIVRHSKTKDKTIVEGAGIKVIEENGVTKCPKNICPSEREARRFYSKDGVIGVYMCSQHGRAIMASPDGFIKVSISLLNPDGSYKDSTVAERIQEARNKAAEIGITIDKEIPHADCEATEKEDVNYDEE